MLDISPVLLLSSGIIFLLVVARLNSCLFKPILKHMDERSASIKKDMEDAKSNSSDVDGLLAEANDIIAKAKKEAAVIREQAYKEAKDSADVKLASAKLNLEAKSAEFAKNLQEETQALRDSLLSSMPQFNESLKNKLSSI
ncbi:F0F1 ATP synthase subunit B family protein [Aliarcobacter cibarius]|jgi:F-type H+-transporting ATPase subunit b|uniref:ATP synthase, F0 complex, b' subunit n=1 Tax=Aliarcobacter cibarius TaxID=255507 RepID=A0A5J6RI81_9BACT|nr:ATP synthase F0 subunit B' [Aliarcobacter cibarius]QEZ89632.1 ATP synthase, F0 complex, b' subunit [Aliarcobacter cibarius]QKJ27639.1 ATP synthase, F0 complex, b' subunit [Aliarcobacter cibarius]TLT00677.1 F0F1 ATP synthase subunit B' [Aliarcobacter cibarius]TLT00971.1 F0F1 ATP synthase subunit B' [Aliarcobacter cibarius]TLT03885.1 F0F1 ATP synthase subunit B' [Aliarcobacter cibarius]